MNYKLHALNYILIKSGIREFCQKCNGCCEDRYCKDLLYGCRNPLCLGYICDDLKRTLNRKFGVIINLFQAINYLKEVKYHELTLIKRIVDTYSDYNRLILNTIHFRESNKKVKDNQRLMLAIAEEFDKKTLEIFNRV